MTTVTLSPAVLRARSVERPARRRFRWRRFPYEGTVLFVVALVVYLAVANYVVLQLHYTNADAFSRVGNAHYVIFSRDRHLGAIGFIWPPLPSFLDIPLLLFKPWFPELARNAFAGSIEAAAFSAGTAVVLNNAYRRARLIFPIRWLLFLVWLANPMLLLYGVQGMSEATFNFFIVASVLRFLRWAEDRRAVDLTWTGILVGLGMLCRWEFYFLAVIIGAGVLLCSLRRGRSWRETETNVLLYGLPVVFSAVLWLGMTAVIEGDFLFAQHSPYAAGQIAATNGFGLGGNHEYQTWTGAGKFIGVRALSLFPAVVPLVALLVTRVVLVRDRIPGLILLGLAFPVLLLDVYLLKSASLAPVLRYQIYVIPFSFVAGAYLLRDTRRNSGVAGVLFTPLVGLALVAALGGSGLYTLDTLQHPDLAPEEAPLVAAVKAHASPEQVDRDSVYRTAKSLADKVTAADKDHGVVLLDTFRAGSLILNAPDPTMYLVTSDENFQPAVADPLVYHVTYILVPEPVGESSLDYINRQYPRLWANGDNFADLVGELGTENHWRLYRIRGA